MAEPTIIDAEVVGEAEVVLADITLLSDRDLLLTLIHEQEKTNQFLSDLREAANSQSESLNWLTENTAGLFGALAQMNAAGGPMALLGMIGKGQ